MYVGTNAGVEERIGPDTEVINLAGPMLLSGLQDSHMHPILGGVLERLCRLDDATTNEAARECTRTSSENWVLEFGWRSSIYLPDLAPGKDDLDGIIPDRPAVLIAKDMHTFWLNSRIARPWQASVRRELGAGRAACYL